MKQRSKTNPLVSIIVPAFNAARYISVCLDSILGQTYSNIEVVIIDDGSTDETKDIIKGYSEKDCRIVYIIGNHLGANVARGLGVKRAKGDYFMFVDSDDWLELDAVEKLVDAMTENHCDLIRFNAITEPDKRLKNSLISEGSGDRIIDGNEAKRILAMEPILNNLCFQFYRANLFDNVTVFEKKLSNCEDHLVNLEVYDHVTLVLFISNILYHYRINYNSTTNNLDADRRKINLKEQIYVYSTILKRTSSWDFSEEDQKQTAIVALDRVRSGIFAFSKAKNVDRQKYVSLMKDVHKNKDFQYIRQCVGSEERTNDYIRSQPSSYKLKCGHSLIHIYNEDIVSLWRSMLFFRLASRLKQITRIRAMMGGGNG